MDRCGNRTAAPASRGGRVDLLLVDLQSERSRMVYSTSGAVHGDVVSARSCIVATATPSTATTAATRWQDHESGEQQSEH